MCVRAYGLVPEIWRFINACSNNKNNNSDGLIICLKSSKLIPREQ